MTESARLRIPYLAAAQAQKHVTHNEAMTLLDTLVQLAVLDRDLAAPPSEPSEGDTYIVAASATGAWEGWDGRVARYIDGIWRSYLPGAGGGAGWLAWVIDEGVMVRFDGAAWNLAGIEGPQGPAGAQGQGIEPDAAGSLAERDAFDDEAQGFVYLRTDATPFEFYVKASATSGDWAGPSAMASDGAGALATNVSFLSLLVADLLGDRIDIVEGWVDPFDDEGDVDTGSSANQTYDAAGDYYRPAVSATFESIFAVTLDADANGYGGFTIRNVIDAAALGSVAFTPERARVSLRAGSSEGFTVTAAYIGHKAGSGDPYDFAAAPVQVTFDGGAATRVIGAGSEAVSDAVDFAWNGTSGLVVSIYCNGGGSSDMLRKKDAVANAESYIKAENSPATVNVSGYSADADVQLLAGIEVAEATGMLEMDLRSSAFTASVEPDEAKLLIEVEEVDTASANTDFRGYVSRDDGSSWEEGALALRLTTPAGRRIYEAVGIDLSAQGAGTDIRARFTTHNAKDVRLHGWALSVG